MTHAQRIPLIQLFQLPHLPHLAQLKKRLHLIQLLQLRPLRIQIRFISEETLKNLYADRASKRANHNATTSSASLPNPKLKRPAFDAFQTKFKWARIYDSEHFPFDDVLSEQRSD